MIENGTIITTYKNGDEIYDVKWTDEGLLVPVTFTDSFGGYSYNIILYLRIKKDIIKQIIDDCLEEKNSEGAKMRPIYAEKLKNSYGWWEGNDRQLTRDEARHYFDAMIDAQPTADVELVKHGQWIWKDYYSVPGDYYPEDVWECDLCGKSIIGKKENYCPNCGADMRGEQK